VRKTARAVITAVAARDPARAAAFARTNGIASVHESYAAVLADPTIDAVYIGLPTGLHKLWAIRALQVCPIP
jgi:predicted dehydrogenase